MKGDNIADRLLAYGSDVMSYAFKIPRNDAGKHIRLQLIRAGTAGGANYEEARSAQSRSDFVFKVSLAAKEIRESRYWLRLVKKSELACEFDSKSLLKEANELISILMSCIKTARKGCES